MGSGRKHNGTRPVNKADGGKGKAKKAITKSVRQDKKKEIKTEQFKDPRIEEIYEDEITFTCPVRGLVTQKVKVKRYKSPGQMETKTLTAPMSEFVDALEEKDNGLSIYDSGDELGVTNIPEGSDD
jgi:hypothetical protein